MENPYQLYYYTLSSDTHCQRMLLIRDWGLSNCFVKKKLRCFSYGKVESFLIKIGCVNLISLPKNIFIILITVLFFIVGDLFLIYSNSSLAVKPSSIKILVTSLTKKQPEKERAQKNELQKNRWQKNRWQKKQGAKKRRQKNRRQKNRRQKNKLQKNKRQKKRWKRTSSKREG